MARIEKNLRGPWVASQAVTMWKGEGTGRMPAQDLKMPCLTKALCIAGNSRETGLGDKGKGGCCR